MSYREVFRNSDSMHLLHQKKTKRDRKNAPSEGVALWQWIDSTFFLKGSDMKFWWRNAGYALAVLLCEAGYPLQFQYQHLIFFAFIVTRELGPAMETPSRVRWKSFMTDDNMPIELSWDWGLGGEQPVIRYSVEPIGANAGTLLDQLNQHAGPRFLQKLGKSLQGVDLRWTDHLFDEFATFNNARELNAEKHQTRFFAAFDLSQGDIIVKAYFFPAFKAAESGQSRSTTITEALKRLPDYSSSTYPAFDIIWRYLRDPSIQRLMNIEMLAIDCIEPAKSRFKVYVRSQSTSFNSVKKVMTLDGTLDTPKHKRGLEELQYLWELLFGRDYCTDRELPQIEHRTAGILYNFEVKANEALPVPKVYIPVRHYVQNEFLVLEGLRLFMQHRHEYQPTDMYLRAMKTIFSYDSLRRKSGIHTYIGCAIKNGSLRLVSYLNPQFQKISNATDV